MEKNANGMASTDGVIKFQQILFECIWISCFYYIHAHRVQGLNRFVYGPMFLLIVSVIEPDNGMEKSRKDRISNYTDQACKGVLLFPTSCTSTIIQN